jgi:A1 cistron-splicing factor AAR2
MKLIPPGMHYFVYSVGTDIKEGVFLNFAPGQVIVRRWDRALENFVALSEEEATRYAAGVRRFDFDASLAAYAPDLAVRWGDLGGLITETVLARCGVPPGTPTGTLDPVARDSSSDGAGGGGGGSGGSGGSGDGPDDVGRRASFVTLRSCRRLPGMSAEEVTMFNLDCSAGVQTTVDDAFGGNFRELLGELQLAFALFLTISSLPAFEHWKSAVSVLCTCEAMSQTTPLAVGQFALTLAGQLKHVPADFFHDPISGDNFLRPALCDLFSLRGCGEGSEGMSDGAIAEVVLDPGRAQVAANLADALRILRRCSQDKFGIDFGDPASGDVGEDAPVVVFTGGEEEDEAEEKMGGGGMGTGSGDGDGSGGSGMSPLELELNKEMADLGMEEEAVMGGAGMGLVEEQGETKVAPSRMEWMLPPPTT